MGKNMIRYKGYTFGLKDDIKSGSCFLSNSLLGDTLSINTLEFQVESEAENLADFEKNSPATYLYDGKQIGVFYVQAVERVQANTYDFSAVSAIGLLSEGRHYGGIYTGQTAQELISDICGSIPFSLKTNLQEIKLYGWLPVAAPRDNLAEVLFAIGASVRTDLYGVLRIEPLWDGIANQLNRDRMYEGPSVKYASKVTQVIVTEHQYVEGGSEKKLFEGASQQGDIITFDSPMHDLTASGFSILESGANYAKISGGSGTLTGKEYIHNTREIIRNVSEAQEPNIKAVKDATLVSLTNSHAVAERMANYFQCTETIQSSVVYHGESPGDRLATYHPYDKNAAASCLESADINLSNTLKSDEKLLVGFVPPKPEAGYYDVTERIVQDGVWQVPEGVTHIRAVIIGGGQGGWSGLPGEDSPNEDALRETYTAGDVTTHNYGRTTTKPGEGGGAGEGGQPGKIYIIDIDVNPGDSFNTVIGQGGAGGIAGSTSNEGKNGGATQFGSYSSELGSENPNGFLEETSKEILASAGKQGIPGGNGNGRYRDGEDWIDVTGKTITADGQQYKPGINSDTEIEDSRGSTAQGDGYVEATAYGGYGGGAAYGADGENGYDAIETGDTGPNGYVNATSSRAESQGAKGGNGATALPPPDQETIGSGGMGGNGGGGAGSRGLGLSTNRVRTSLGTKATLTNYAAEIAEGGQGSNGGKGGSGGIILYYSSPVRRSSGAVYDRNGWMILDKLGRRLIV